MRILPLALLAACSSTLTTFDDKVTPPTDGLDTGSTTGDDDDDDDVTTGDDDDVTTGDDDDDVTTGDDDDDTTVPVNTDPVAIADAQSILVFVGETVRLDASASYDDDGDTLTYQWTLLRVPQAAGTVGLLDDDTDLAEFVAQWPGEYLAELVVDDGLASSVDEVLVTAEEPNEVPVANAGTTQRVTVGDIVVLDGSASYDPNTPPDPITYQWAFASKPAGSAAAISNPVSVSPSFTADVVGNYEVGLIVNDGSADSSPGFVRVIAEPEQSTSDGDSCFSCAQANLELERRLTVGDAAGGAGLVLLPLLVLFLQRRDD